MAGKQATTRLVRPLRGGQITIPVEFRKRLGITEDTMLKVTLTGDELRIRPVRGTETVGGSPWLIELYEEFAPVREEATQFSEEEIDATIDRAVAGVREKRAGRP